jgi:hypothetical protein
MEADYVKTCGYDILLELDESLLNKALAAVFYTGTLKKSGDYAFVDGIPKELQCFTSVKYKARLKNEPYVDLFGENKVYLKLSVELFLTVLTGIEIEFDVDFRALADIKFDMSKKTVSYDLSNTEISGITINDKMKVNKNALVRMNEIIGLVLSKFLTEDIKEVEIPLAMYNLELPEMPEGEQYLLPISVADIKILNKKVLAVGIDLFESTGGDLSQVADFTDGSEFFIAMKEDTLKKVFDFWWSYTNLKEKRDFEGELPVTFKEKLGKGLDIFTRLITLGFIETESQVKDAVIKYQGSVEILEKPEFDFDDNGLAILKKLKVKAAFSAHIDALVNKKINLDTSSFVPDKVTSWEDDIKLGQSEKQQNLLPVKEEATLDLTDACCRITLNNQNNLVIKLESADFNLDLGGKWYQNLSANLLNQLLNLFEDNIIHNIPGFVISPSLVSSSVKIMGYSFGVTLGDVSFDNSELLIKANIGVNELSQRGIPVPLYIASKNSKKLHRFDCEAVDDIDFENRIGYHIYDEALRNGFKPCGLCLKK